MTLAVALVATVFGVGALGRVANVYDGSVWLWSSKGAQVSRVNATSARVDLRQPVADARGNRVRVTQNDRYLILHNLDTGRVTSVDLKSLGFSGRLDVGLRGDFRFVLNEKDAFIIDRTTGEIRVVNPATLQPTGTALRLPGPLVGGEFDGAGELWVASPGQGTAIGVRLAEGRPQVVHTVPVAPPGHDLAVTVLDKGLLAVDRSGRDLVAVADGRADKIASPVPLAGATMPDRTNGSLAAVTVPPVRAVVTITNVLGDDKSARATTLNDTHTGTAVPFGGKLYVPDSDGRRVRVYEPGGKQVSVITIPGGSGGLELEVREDNLFINDPGGRKAAVVSRGGEVKVVDKEEGPSTIGGNRTPEPRPTDRPSNGPKDNAGDQPSHPADDATSPARPALPSRPAVPPVGGVPSQPGQPSVPAQPSASPPVVPPVPEEPAPDPGDPPGAPVPVTALAGDRQVRLSWARAHSPDAPIDSYRVTWTGGARTVPGDRLDTVVTGLTDGRAYRFRVTATNRFGTGPFGQSEEVTPTGSRPDTPTNVTAEVKNGVAVVCWDQVKGSSGYVINSINQSGTADYAPRTWGNEPIIVVNGVPRVEIELPGLPAGTWRWTVVARDANGGTSGVSAPSNSVRVGGANNPPPNTPPPNTPPPNTPPPNTPPPNDPPPNDPPPPADDVMPGDDDWGDVIPVDPGPDDGQPGEIPGHPPLDG
ncbi:fibronectin type III domain-containing protein [Actinomadura sp. HBU206391]|uniref:fibronectin type III domain-containing protein n=1 Tax=Actinomadura sp. HBU206391 TaxID=2731692 RepID=UPI0016507260|nr:fibronectin type III domain-containing protein [Actinomadura sp. HBU206391]MBC6462128.1 fibronectin type III domain-containing protein [Actinomadura sp. HBU206391]